MLNFTEHPRGVAKNGPIVNRGELHLPDVVLLDLSGSLEGFEKQIRDGLDAMIKALNDQARGRVEFCVIGFDDDARILVPFGPVYDFEVPHFECGGMTAMHAAVELGLNELEIRKAQYIANKTAYYRPWMYMLTDGRANDEDNGAFERLIQAQRDGHCIFYPVAMGNQADKKLLKSLQKDGVVLTASKENFEGAFEWLSNSLNHVSVSIKGQEVQLANLGDHQLKVES